MTTAPKSWDAAVFDRIYAQAADPWSVLTSAYERTKYAATLAALRGRRFRRALEVGCSIGAFTQRLARQCDGLLALDLADAAVAAARRRCRELPWVRIEQRRIPAQWPGGRFDLIVFSEVLYFLDRSDLVRTARHAAASLLPGGMILLANWTGATDTPVTGDAAARLFTQASRLRSTWRKRRPGYRLDVLAAAGGERRGLGRSTTITCGYRRNPLRPRSGTAAPSPLAGSADGRHP